MSFVVMYFEIVISGAEGGTGASPASSMRFAGISPEIGLSETQQTLVKNGLRGHVRVQVDGQLKTGRDIVLMALLGAEEYGFGTAALIVLGCVMMRKCNLNTCPLGVTSQDPELRKHFIGKSDYLVNYFTFLAQEVREYLAEMGFTKLEDIVGHTELIEKKKPTSEKTATLDFTRLLNKEANTCSLYHTINQPHDLDNVLDQQIIRAAQRSIADKEEVNLDYAIKNTDRAVGTMLSGMIAERYGEDALPTDTINVRFKGSAGQSFGAFLVKGVNFKLEGETNDYFGKGLSGGRIAILPPTRSNFSAEDNIIAGNTGLYGATSGELYINGKVGERFGVRNSGAIAVIEGAGDHCCEYMTGGRVVVLGETGRNFAAGMSGGVAYVWDKNHNFDYFCNMDMVEINLVEDSSYRKELHELIRQHYLYTGSKLARTMLDDWNHYVEDFIQVVPIEYKRVLQEEQVKKLQQKIADMQRDYKRRDIGQYTIEYTTSARSNRHSTVKIAALRPAVAWTAACPSATGHAPWVTNRQSGTTPCTKATTSWLIACSTQPTTSLSSLAVSARLSARRLACSTSPSTSPPPTVKTRLPSPRWRSRKTSSASLSLSATARRWQSLVPAQQVSSLPTS